MLLPQTVDCLTCETTFEHVFTAPEGVEDRQDIVEPWYEWAHCPACGSEFFVMWEGWIAHDDAG